MSDHSPEPRERLLWPILIPVTVLVVIGAILFLFSRVLLRVTPTAATITALVVAASILAVASVVASRPQVTGASLLSMVGGVTGIAMLAGGLALLLGQPTQEAQPVIVALTAPKGAATDGYQTKSLSAPAAYPFTIAFTNDDTGVQHNVVITAQKAVDPTGAIAAGQPVTGVGTVDVPVSPLTAGSYYFFCEFHPTTMFGTLTVAGPPPASGAPAGPVITAQDLKFSPTSLDVSSGQPTTITFDNEDPGVLHNIQFFSDKDYTTSIYKGPDVTGVASSEYQLPALDPGTYYFHCDYHPTTMQGTITVAKSGGGGDVAVTLKQWAVTPTVTAVPAGSVTFTVKNNGTIPHEFVVLQTETPAADFPITSFEGEPERFNEDTAGRNVGETGDMKPGTTKTLTIDLAPGHYAFVCNLPGHYGQGMHTDFTVT